MAAMANGMVGPGSSLQQWASIFALFYVVVLVADRAVSLQGILRHLYTVFHSTMG